MNYIFVIYVRVECTDQMESFQIFLINYQYFQEVIKYYQGYHVKLSLHLISILLIMSTSKEAIISKLRPQMKEFIETKKKKKLYVPSVAC